MKVEEISNDLRWAIVSYGRRCLGLMGNGPLQSFVPDDMGGVMVSVNRVQQYYVSESEIKHLLDTRPKLQAAQVLHSFMEED